MNIVIGGLHGPSTSNTTSHTGVSLVVQAESKSSAWLDLTCTMATLIWGLDKFKDQAIETRHIMDCEEEKKIYLDSKMVVQDRGDQYICAKRWPYIYGHCLPLWALKSLLHPAQVIPW